MLRHINTLLQRWNAAAISAVLLVVAVVLACVVYMAIDMLLFPGELEELLIEVLIGSTIVASPLIAIFTVTVKRLDHSKDRYKRL